MAVSRISATAHPNPSTLLTPLLPALTAAAASKEPAPAVLPLLSPILRQRVQFLAPSSTDPWLRLLCYDTAKAARLAEIATNGSLEPHPVSGEVEVDWDYDSETRFRRADPETLQAFVVLKELGLAFQLVYCVGDKDGGGDGWRIGELTVPEKTAPFQHFGGVPTVSEAEAQFEAARTQKQSTGTNGLLTATNFQQDDEAEDDDDDYWARYDATPARTPAQKASPAPQAVSRPVGRNNTFGEANTTTEDDAYFAQYDRVQPAMDNHDPDEEEVVAQYAGPLGLGSSPERETHMPRFTSNEDDFPRDNIAQPRPDSSASSNGSHTVARLEEEAGKQEHGEFGVKQHISRTIRSLWMLSRASGIDKDEFERIVKTEIDVLGMMGDVE